MAYKTYAVHMFSSTVLVIALTIFTKITNGSAEEPCSTCSRDSSKNATQHKSHSRILDDTFSNYVLFNSLFDDINRETYETVGYPYQKIREAFNTLNIGTFMYSPPRVHFYTSVPKSRVDLENRVQEDIEKKGRVGNALNGSDLDSEVAKPVCKEYHRRVRPLTGTATDGKGYFIVNIKGVVQVEELITCYKKDEGCGDKSRTPENYAHSCRQSHVEVLLLSFSDRETDLTKAIFNATYRVAHGCSCEMHRLPRSRD